MGIDDGWSKGGRCYERLRRTIGPDFGDGVLDAIDRRDTEIARVEAERDAAVAKMAAVRAECALLRRLVVMPGPDGVATHDYAADRIEAALDAPATEEE